jgi:hypothetical protein
LKQNVGMDVYAYFFLTQSTGPFVVLNWCQFLTPCQAAAP